MRRLRCADWMMHAGGMSGEEVVLVIEGNGFEVGL